MYKKGKQNIKGKNYTNNKKRTTMRESGSSSHSDTEGQERSTNVIPLHNDWSFYAVDEVIAKQVSNIPFNVLTGDVVPTTGTRWKSGEEETTNVVNSSAAPGFSRIDYIPGFGVSTDATSGISLAANQLYAEMRKNNSGAKVYEAPDLLMFVLAVQDVIANISECVRAIKFVNKYTFTNKYLPKAICEGGFGIDYADLVANRAQYLAQLNTIIASVNTLGIPAYFSSLLRRIYISMNVFMDSDAIRGQYYIFRKMGYYLWDTTSSESGTKLDYKSFGMVVLDGLSTFGDKLQAINSQIQAILSDTDALTMEGDIQKAWDQAQLVSLAYVSADEELDPMFDMDILAQIENAVFPPSWISSDSSFNSQTLDLTQEGAVLKWQPTANATVATASVVNDRVFNSHKVDPDYRDVLEWSRLSSVWSLTTASNTSVQATLMGCGLEVPVSLTMYAVIGGELNPVEFVPYISSTSQLTAGTAIFLMYLGSMDWHPAVYWVDASPLSNTLLLANMDLKVSTVISANTMIMMHNAANYASYYNRSLRR